jgi:hypothetical protein
VRSSPSIWLLRAASVFVNYASSKEGADRVAGGIVKVGGKAKVHFLISGVNRQQRFLNEFTARFNLGDRIWNSVNLEDCPTFEMSHPEKVHPARPIHDPCSNSAKIRNVSIIDCCID